MKHPTTLKASRGTILFNRFKTFLSKPYNVILLLKGHNTVITDGKTCYLNPTGNPGMATGGSGDVLAGMITALVGQGIKPLEATACAAWLH